jgi:hypothetical protein
VAESELFWAVTGAILGWALGSWRTIYLFTLRRLGLLPVPEFGLPRAEPLPQMRWWRVPVTFERRWYMPTFAYERCSVGLTFPWRKGITIGLLFGAYPTPVVERDFRAGDRSEVPLIVRGLPGPGDHFAPCAFWKPIPLWPGIAQITSGSVLAGLHDEDCVLGPGAHWVAMSIWADGQLVAERTFTVRVPEWHEDNEGFVVTSGDHPPRLE